MRATRDEKRLLTVAAAHERLDVTSLILPLKTIIAALDAAGSEWPHARPLQAIA